MSDFVQIMTLKQNTHMVHNNILYSCFEIQTTTIGTGHNHHTSKHEQRTRYRITTQTRRVKLLSLRLPSGNPLGK